MDRTGTQNSVEAQGCGIEGGAWTSDSAQEGVRGGNIPAET